MIIFINYSVMAHIFFNTKCYGTKDLTLLVLGLIDVILFLKIIEEMSHENMTDVNFLKKILHFNF